MKTEISADSPISESFLSTLVSAVEDGLARFADRLTRAEVHLKNISGTGPNPACTLEVRPAGRTPVVVSCDAGSTLDAVQGALEKMERLLESTFGKEDSRRGPSASGQPT